MSDIKLVLDNNRTYFRFSNEYAELVKCWLAKQFAKDPDNTTDDIRVALTSSGMQAITTTMQVVMSCYRVNVTIIKY